MRRGTESEEGMIKYYAGRRERERKKECKSGISSERDEGDKGEEG